MKSWVLMIILAVASEVIAKSTGESGDYTVMCIVLALFMFFGERTECNLKKKRENVIFGKIVKKRLIEVDMTQSELARALNIKQPYMAMITNGTRTARKYRKQICDILGLDIEAVLRKMAA